VNDERSHEYARGDTPRHDDATFSKDVLVSSCRCVVASAENQP
jgi:hypothetical protein